MTHVFRRPDYARTRNWTNWNEGSADALALMTGWLKAGDPFCHVRYADGEFWSILGRVGPNADGQEHLPGTLGKDLALTLKQIADEHGPRSPIAIPPQPGHLVLVGGYWDVPAGAKSWLEANYLLDSVPWCPVQCFVDGILGGHTMEFLKALTNLQPYPKPQPDDKGLILRRVAKLYLVANEHVGRLAPALGAEHVRISLPPRKARECVYGEPPPPQVPNAYGVESGSYADMTRVREYLKERLRPGDVVVWCAGLGCKPTLWRLFRECPGTTHVDMGCFFDLAAGLVSRTWMTSPPDERQTEYREKYIPWLKEGQK